MRRALLRSIVFAAAISNLALAQPVPSEKNGKIVYDKWCAPCHGAEAPKTGMFAVGALPGTAALALKYRGKVPAVLEQRTDLAPAFINTVVRHGMYGMPITRKTEISDVELDDIVAYLTRNKKP